MRNNTIRVHMYMRVTINALCTILHLLQYCQYVIYTSGCKERASEVSSLLAIKKITTNFLFRKATEKL